MRIHGPASTEQRLLCAISGNKAAFARNNQPLSNPEKNYIQQEQAKVLAYPYPCDEDTQPENANSIVMRVHQ